jgi:hypothetical protein
MQRWIRLLHPLHFFRNRIACDHVARSTRKIAWGRPGFKQIFHSLFLLV